MRSVTTFNTICPFCGKNIQVRRIVEDGIDWEGHHRGSYREDVQTDKCTCEYGVMVGKMPPVKPMCENCKHYKHGYCENPDKISEIKSIISNFEIALNRVSVKNPKFCCNLHELDFSIFSRLFRSER